MTSSPQNMKTWNPLLELILNPFHCVMHQSFRKYTTVVDVWCIKAMYENAGAYEDDETFTHSLIESAILGYTNIFILLYSMSEPYQRPPRLGDWIARGGNVDIMRFWWIEQGNSVDCNVGELAIIHGHLDLVKFLLLNQCHFYLDSCRTAQENRQIHILLWLRERKLHLAFQRINAQ